MPTIPQLIAESREEFDKKFIGEYDIVDDGENDLHISGIMDKGLYSVDGLMDSVRTWHITSLISLIDALMEEEEKKQVRHSKDCYYLQNIYSLMMNRPKFTDCDCGATGVNNSSYNRSSRDTIKSLQAIKDELMK